MNNKKEIAKLDDCIKNKRLCAIEREYIDTLYVYGFPIKTGEELLAVEFVYDFMADGIKVMRKSDISGIFCSEEEAFLEKVIRNENENFDVKDFGYKLDNMTMLLEDIKNSGRIVSVECEDFEENILLIGQIVAVGKKSVSLRTFDGVGKWDKDYSSVDIEDVTCVTIDNSYVSIISKYLSE